MTTTITCDISTCLSRILVSTCFDDRPVLHEDHHVSFVHKLYAVCAKDSGLSPEEVQDTFLHEVFGHVGIDCCQRIIEEVDVFVLRRCGPAER